jgi:hypothetical protein
VREGAASEVRRVLGASTPRAGPARSIFAIRIVGSLEPLPSLAITRPASKHGSWSCTSDPRQIKRDTIV